MREAAFLKQNSEKWKELERALDPVARGGAGRSIDPDRLARWFVELTDDLSYARTFYPQSATTRYLNDLTRTAHQAIYRNKRERKGRIVTFWREELPRELYRARRELLYALVIFLMAASIGALSAAGDESFIRLILGDSYVNTTLENISNGDPMAIYKSGGEVDMFLMITFNNIRVAFMAFAAGLLISFGTLYILFFNGVMLGAFQYFFYQKGLLLTSVLAIWIHGTLEISAIVIAGAAGLTMGNSILFPGTYTRTRSFVIGARRGMKIAVGLVPIFIMAGFLESFVTRHSSVSSVLSASIIIVSLAFVVGYFIYYPAVLERRLSTTANGADKES